MNIFVKTLDGKTILLEVEVDNFIKQVKEKIFEQEEIPVNQQCLIYWGRVLDNWKTMKDYNIQNESTLHLVKRKQQEQFVQPNEHEISTSAYDRLFIPNGKIGKGINFKVRCNNQNCNSQKYGGFNMVKKGFGTFDLLKEMDEMCCPRCYQKADFTTCGFYNCQYQFKGIKENGYQQIVNNEAGIEKFQEYEADEFSDMITWKELVFEVNKK